MKKISVLMPVAKRENPSFLENALRSLATQTLPPSQVVIIEDAERPEELNRVFERFRDVLPFDFLMLEPGHRLGFLLNQGLKRCEGEYIARMDSDDISLPQRFEKQVAYLEAHPDIDVLGSCAVEIDSQGNRGALRKRPLAHEDILKTLWANPFVHPSVMFRKGLVESVGGYDEDAIGEDFELWFRGAKAGWRFSNMEEPLILYRFDSESLRKSWRSFRPTFQQALLGFKLTGEFKMPLRLRLACFAPVLRSLMPGPLKTFAYALQKKFDPRYK